MEEGRDRPSEVVQLTEHMHLAIAAMEEGRDRPSEVALQDHGQVKRLKAAMEEGRDRPSEELHLSQRLCAA